MKTIISIPARLKYKHLSSEDQHKKVEELQTILKKVKDVLEDEEVMEQLQEIEKDLCLTISSRHWDQDWSKLT